MFGLFVWGMAERRARIRGIRALIHDAVELTVDRVGDGQASTARGAARIAGLISPELVPLVEGVHALASIPLVSVRTVNRAIARHTDTAVDAAVSAALGEWIDSPAERVPLRSDITNTAAWISDATLGALNGAAGDYLHRTKNPLDLGFVLRAGDRDLSQDATAGGRGQKFAVFVHGLGTTEWSWCWGAAEYHGDPSTTFGSLLQRDLGFIPIYARYNTGRRVSDNGQLLADRLEGLFGGGGGGGDRSPPIEDLILAGHSMGGLVVRSACEHARRAGHRWLGHLSRVFSLGTPHQGAPLAKLGQVLTEVLGAVDHPGTLVPAELLRRRSAGIRDLEQGALIDRSETGEPPLLEGVAYHFLSATITRDRAHPLGVLIGDVLVRVESASGPAVVRRSELAIATECFGGIAHHQLQNHPDVYAWLKRACE